MQNLTPAGENIVAEIARRYNLSTDAVIHMLVAVNNGGCTMAQFNCPELGGGGQWMAGGMTMVGDMFNHGLKATVDNLCSELANALSTTQMFPVIPAGTPGSNQWWPADLGAPFSSGAQNNIRYAVFPGRLAVELNGEVTVYDTLDHNIGGVSQQQGGNTSLTFSSQYGTVAVSSLPVISGNVTPAPPVAPPVNFAEPVHEVPVPEQPAVMPQQPIAMADQGEGAAQSADELLALIEKLAQLRDAGVLSDSEYDAKKSDLLSRI